MLKMDFKKQITVILLAVGIIPAILVTFVSVVFSANAITDQAFNQLDSIRASKATTVKNYLNFLTQEVVLLAKSPEIQHGLVEFDHAFHDLQSDSYQLSSDKRALKNFYESEFMPRWHANNATIDKKNIDTILTALSDKAVYYQHRYIVSNTNPVGSKDKLITTGDNDAYDRHHMAIHPFLSSVQKKFQFYDIFLIDTTGTVLYTVFKEIDFATSLTQGPYKTSGLADAFKKAMDLPDGQFAITDFAPYQPSYDAPAGFIATPVFDNSGQKVGVIAAQFPIDALNAVMGQRDGLGETGETYLVGQDYLMRSDSYLDPENHNVLASFLFPEKGSVKTEAVERALTGQTGQDIIVDYNHNPVLSAFSPLDFGNLGWVILAEIDEAEALASRKNLIWQSIVIIFISVLVVIFVSIWVSNLVLKPLGAEPKLMREIAERISGGDLTIHFDKSSNNSVYGAMASMVKNLRHIVTEIRNDANIQASTAQELAAISEQTSVNINQQNTNTREIASAMNEMTATVSDVADNTTHVATASREAKDNVSSSAQQVIAATDSVHQVSEGLHLSGEKVNELANRVKDISAVIESIQNISNQTNLLALNAAIEAARAGESGRGFAVVADEVRDLAQNTQKETEQIAAIIAALQSGAQEAQSVMQDSIKNAEETSEQTTQTVKQLQEAVHFVERVDEMASQIASATVQQNSVAQTISQNIEALSTSSEETEQAISQISRSSEEVAQQSTVLNDLVSTFKI